MLTRSKKESRYNSDRNGISWHQAVSSTPPGQKDEPQLCHCRMMTYPPVDLAKELLVLLPRPSVFV